MSPPKNRSVLDYDNEQSLRAALMMPPREHAHLPEGRTDSERKETNSLSNLQSSVESEKLDWVLPAYNPETTEAQSMKEELRRLLVLKSYLILDAEREIAFDRITGMASRMFDVPICLVSLVDLGRQWFVSNRGLGETRETPRRHAFCAHAILSKSDIFVVPDATKDFRFKDNPLVTSSPNIRFYAGTPLVSPEGYKLGTFCIIDKKPWPDGLSNSQEAILKDLSDTVVHEMKNRRERLMNDGSTSQLIATTAHDLLTPLSGVQLSLTLLKEDEQVQSRLGPQQIELLNTASNCSDVMIRICRSTMESFRDETTNDSTSVSTGVSSTLTQLAELKKSLLMILDPTPKRVPLIITIAKDVPATIVCDDLKLFRSALNLLTTALARTKYGKVHLTVRVGTESGWDGGNKELYFECQDTAKDIKSENYKLLFQPSRPHDGELRMALSSVALLITSLEGRYGFKPFKRKDSPPSECSGEGSVFWFCVPLMEATEEMIAKSASLGQISVLRSSESLTAMAPSLARQFRMRSVPNIAAVLEEVHRRQRFLELV